MFAKKESILFHKKWRNSASHLINKKDIFYKLVADRTEEIEKLPNNVNFEDLIYYFKGSFKHIYLNHFIDAETLFDDIKSQK